MKRMPYEQRWKNIGRAAVCAIAIAVIVPSGLLGCKKGSKTIDVEAYFTDFGSADELENWACYDSAKWEIQDGALVANAVGIEEHRSILWFKEPLPEDLQVEFEAECLETANDINCFIHGNGKNYSGYEVIIGGFENRYVAVYKSGEDGNDTKRDLMERQEFEIEKDHVYGVIVRKLGKNIEVSLDGDILLTATDKDLIRDAEHRYFGLSTFENTVRFDNLRIKKKE